MPTDLSTHRFCLEGIPSQGQDSVQDGMLSERIAIQCVVEHEVSREVKQLNTSRTLCVWAFFLMFSATVFAHHGYAAYDMQVIKTLKGTVTNFMIMNPHSQMGLDVKDASGNVDHWTLEAILAPRGMKDGGWEYDSLKPGDEVTIYYHPVKGPGRVGLFVRVVFPDGRTLPKNQANSSSSAGQ
jgi:hypothetical protein